MCGATNVEHLLFNGHNIIVAGQMHPLKGDCFFCYTFLFYLLIVCSGVYIRDWSEVRRSLHALAADTDITPP